MLISSFLHNLSETYYCNMNMELIDAEKQHIILEDGSQYFYTVKPVQIANALGTAVAVLDEYFISNSSGENYKLYKTKEGNWYDVAEANKGVDNSVLMGLKLTIDGL